MYFSKKNRWIAAAAVVFLSLAGSVKAQNQLPQIKNVSVKVNPATEEVRISYRLSDKEESRLSVAFQVSDNRGATYAVNTGNATGDIGTNVKTGNRTITWKYAGTGIDISKAAFKIIADDGYKIGLNELLGQVDTNRIKSRLTAIAKERTTQTATGKKQLSELKNMLHQTWEQQNYRVERQPFNFGEYDGENIIARKTGTVNKDSLYVLCASFDCEEESPGANANGSGLAGIMEIADILSKYNCRNTLVVLGTDYAGEEYIGSNNFVFKGGVKPDERVQAAIDLSRIGVYNNAPNSHPVNMSNAELFPDNYQAIIADSTRANFLQIASNTESAPLEQAFRNKAAELEPGVKVLTEEYPGYGEFIHGTTDFIQFGNHVAFWYRKYKAIWVTDARGGSRTDGTKDDTVDRLDFSFMQKVIKISLATLADMAVIEHTSAYEGRFQ
jgi:Peptidase family M28